MPSWKALLSPLVLSVSIVVPVAINSKALASDCQSLDVVRTQLLSGVGHRPYNALMRCSTQAVPTLVRALKTDESSDVRGRAASALVSIEGDASQIAPALMEALKTDESSSVRWRAAEALGSIEGDASQIAPALMEALKTDESSWRRSKQSDGEPLRPDVRGRAAEALVSIEGDASQIAPALMEALKTDAREALKTDESSEVRLRPWGVSREIQIAPALMEALKTDESSSVRWRGLGEDQLQCPKLAQKNVRYRVKSDR